MFFMHKIAFLLVFICTSVFAEPIFHEKKYPDGKGPFPAVLILHTSGGFRVGEIKNWSSFFLKEGYAIYAPNFFERHGITPKKRKLTFTKFRKPIEKDLTEIVEIMKKDPKIDSKNIFAVGFSNGGFWATFMAGTKQVNASSSHYGVWQFGPSATADLKGYPVKYIKKDTRPLLILHPKKDKVQKYKWAKPYITKVAKKSSKVEVHYYEKGGHAWHNKKYKKGVGYNREIYEDAMARTITFFNKYKK